MSSNLRVALELFLKNSGWRRGLQESESSLQRFSRGARTEMDALKRSMSSVTGKLAGIGVGISAAAQLVESSRLTKQLRQIELTAGATAAQGAALRAELFAMSKQTGAPIAELLEGFSDLVAAGQGWKEALATIQATNPAMAVTGASARSLAGSLTVAAQAFRFDLSDVKTGTRLLDQMTVAGRLGNAELENLSSIFATVGGNARNANLGFTETLALIEQMSLIERQPERLATMVDSTLRLFNNQTYLKTAAKATGVSFYDAKGERRQALDVLSDIAAKYQKLPTDLRRDKAFSAAFGATDLDTQRGLRLLLSNGAIGNIRQAAGKIEQAGGTIANDLKQAGDTLVDQVKRLKSTMQEAAELFTRPVEATLTRFIKAALDSKQDGGMALSGAQIGAGGAVAGVAAYALSRLGGGLFRGLLGTAGGVAAGKALEATAGVQPVFVVNMPGGGLGDGAAGAAAGAAAGVGTRIIRPGTFAMLRAAPNLATIASFGAGAVGTAGALTAGAGAAGYGVGTLFHKAIEGTSASNGIGRAVAQVMALFGSKTAQEALASERQAQAAERMEGAARTMQDAKAKITVEITGGGARVQQLEASPGLSLDVTRGLLMQGM